MIAPAKSVRRHPAPTAWQAFLSLMPTIACHARIAFRSRTGDERDDLIQETIANAALAFLRLVELGRQSLAYPSVLARYGIAQVLDGRRVGGRLRIGDVLSPYCHRKKGVVVERLDKHDAVERAWQEVLVEDRQAGPADIAAYRIDFGDWLRSLPRQKRRIAATLALGETTSATAEKFRLSAGRISQVRRELLESWQQFQGELPAQEAGASG